QNPSDQFATEQCVDEVLAAVVDRQIILQFARFPAGSFGMWERTVDKVAGEMKEGWKPNRERLLHRVRSRTRSYHGPKSLTTSSFQTVAGYLEELARGDFVAAMKRVGIADAVANSAQDMLTI